MVGAGTGTAGNDPDDPDDPWEPHKTGPELSYAPPPPDTVDEIA
jgi:hypothetical protein